MSDSRRELEEAHDFDRAREAMVARQLAARGITDDHVLAAFRAVPRHRFLDPGHWDEAYEDHPVRIGCSQTISQPYIVAYMTQLLCLSPGMRVLEIGTGSGYQTAILAALGAEVWTIERHEDLLGPASDALAACGLDGRVHFHVDDGTLGHAEEAPYDRIIVTAAAPEIPRSLRDQLSADGGRMVIPVGRGSQVLTVCVRSGDAFREEADLPVIFVPLIGEQGF